MFAVCLAKMLLPQEWSQREKPRRGLFVAKSSVFAPRLTRSSNISVQSVEPSSARGVGGVEWRNLLNEEDSFDGILKFLFWQ
jgi:hypothetical protein